MVIELDPDSLELTDQCYKDARRVSDRASKDKFYRDYGINHSVLEK